MRQFVGTQDVYRQKYEKIIHQTEKAYLFLLPKGKKAWVPKAWIAKLNKKSFDLYCWVSSFTTYNIEFVTKNRFAHNVEKARLDRVIQRDKDKNKKNMVYLITNQRSAFTPVGYSITTVEESLKYLNKLDSIAFDTETRGFDPYTCGLISAQFGDADKQYVVDCETVNINLYKELLETKEIIMQNAKFDLRFLYYKGIVPVKVFDTMLAERILTTGDNRARRALDFLAYKYCKKEMDKTVRGSIHREGLSTRVIKYAADDVKYLHEIMRKQMVHIKDKGLSRTMSLDNSYVLVLAYIEHCGVFLDREAWQKKCDEDKAALKAVKDELDNYILGNPDKFPEFINRQLTLFDEGVSCKINWNSGKQVIPLMNKIGVSTKTKDKDTGLMKDSVDKKVLAPQKNKFELVKTYLKYAEYQKEVSTYGENWFDYINPVTGRIHTNYTQIMNTGRLSSGQKANKKKNIPQKPNMQNVPSSDRTRNCFVAQRPYDILVVSDYSGQEQIVLANKSKDKDLLNFYKKGLGDMHSFVASKIFPELSEVSLNDIKANYKDKRQIAKGAGFAINYGGTGITIAQNLSLPLDKGEEVYQAYFKAFPGLADYFKKEKQKALKLGYIEFNEVSGRKCFMPYFEEFQRLHKELYGDKQFWSRYKAAKASNSDDFRNNLKPKVREYFMKKGDIERMSLNYPIQGSSADITKLAGIYMFRYLQNNNLLFKVLMPNVVHDELHLECGKDKAEELAKVLKDCMEKAGDKFCKTIKLKAEPCITEVWAH